jgi:hypothetical protein
MIRKCTLVSGLLLGLASTAHAQMMGGGMMGGKCGGMMGGGMMGGKCGGMMGQGMGMPNAMSSTSMANSPQQQAATQLQALANKSNADVRAALQSDQPATRFAAAYMIGAKGLPYPNDVIPLVRDGDPLVRQGARQSLMMLSYKIDAAKKAKQRGAQPRSVDFGPAPNASASGQRTAAQRWQRWMDQNKVYLPSAADTQQTTP